MCSGGCGSSHKRNGAAQPEQEPHPSLPHGQTPKRSAATLIQVVGGGRRVVVVMVMVVVAVDAVAVNLSFSPSLSLSVSLPFSFSLSPSLSVSMCTYASVLVDMCVCCMHSKWQFS